VPGYIAKQKQLKAKGVSDVIIYCVNDSAVMGAWAEHYGATGSMISFLADPACEFSKALGMSLDDPGPVAALGNIRCKRFSMLIEDCVIKTVNISYSRDDPSGGDDPSASCVEKMLADL